ncbi:response regulator [Candidatus Peregrinibacteria bacterium]|nr:response regulator [Candidatus Peregrinibacteria bacterium]
MDKKPYILAVDDNQFVLSNLEQLLLIKGYEVAIARDGKEAQELVLKNRYDLLITDINMPRANGFELAEFIKEKKIALPIIFASAYPEAEDYTKAKSLGAVAIFTKPISLDKLYDVIDKTIELKRRKNV